MAEHKALPAVVSWALWTTRNANLFREEILSPLQVFLPIKFTYDLIRVPLKTKPPRQIGSLDIDKSRALGFLDGACNENRGPCGARGAIARGISSLQVFGDSKLVISWVSRNYGLHALL